MKDNMILIDARGRACPEPVLMTKKALENNIGIKVLVDNTTAKENVKRFSQNSGYSVEIEEQDEDFLLTLRRK